MLLEIEGSVSSTAGSSVEKSAASAAVADEVDEWRDKDGKPVLDVSERDAKGASDDERNEVLRALLSATRYREGRGGGIEGESERVCIYVYEHAHSMYLSM